MGTHTTARQPESAEASGPDSTSISVCHVVGSLGHGGRESLLEDIIRFSPEDIAYTVCGMRVRGDHDDRFERLGVDTVSIDARSDRDFRALVRLARFLARRSFDILHAHGPRAQIPVRLIAPVFGRSAVMSTMHGVPDMFPDGLLRLERLTRILEKRTVAVSNGVSEAFVGRDRASGWVTIRNGLDVERFRDAVERADPNRVRQTYPVSEDDFVLLNIGRYVPPKAQLDLVDAMDLVADSVDDVHLFVVGGRGAMEGRIRDRVAEHGLSATVSVTGRVDDIYPFYALADMFVSSSVGEGLPIVQLEAMAAGLPVVATDIPGVRELVVDGETGLLVPTRNPDRLAEAVRTLTDPDLRRTYGNAGYDRVADEFHIRETVKEYVGLYNEIVHGEREP